MLKGWGRKRFPPLEVGGGHKKLYLEEAIANSFGPDIF